MMVQKTSPCTSYVNRFIPQSIARMSSKTVEELRNSEAYVLSLFSRFSSQCKGRKFLGLSVPPLATGNAGTGET
jgi:hypothetical protein